MGLVVRTGNLFQFKNKHTILLPTKTVVFVFVIFLKFGFWDTRYSAGFLSSEGPLDASRLEKNREYKDSVVGISCMCPRKGLESNMAGKQ